MKSLYQRFIYLTLFAGGLLLFVGCRNGHDVAYLSNAQRDTAIDILQTYSAIVHPGDRLHIRVDSPNPESLALFNEETNRTAGIESSRQNVEIQGYLVGEAGTILFPALGEIPVVGITLDDLSATIAQKLQAGGFVNNPTVTTELMNFRVTVVGEVKTPQEIQVDGTRLTILEALAICEDLTLYGQRTNITIVREVDGKQQFGTIDLTNSDFLNSPYYYLQQNDIVYVEPNRYKKRQAVRNADWPEYVNIGLRIWLLIRTNWNTYRYQQQNKN